MRLQLAAGLADWLAKWAPLLLLFPAALLFVLVPSSRDVNVYDEGVILTAASQVAIGHVPHRDFYANYGPAQFYFLAALFKVFGPSILVERLWGAAIKAAIALCTYLLGNRLMPKSWSLICCLACVVWLGFVENTAWPAWPALLAALIGLKLLFDVFERAAATPQILAAGVCVGVATLFRYDIGFLLCVAETAVLASYRWGETPMRGNLTVRLRNPMLFCAGVALVCLPVAAAFMCLGAVSDFYFDVVYFPAHNYAPTRSLPFPPLFTDASSPLSAANIVYAPILVAVAALARLSRLNAAGRRDDRSFFWKLVLLLVVMLSLFAKGLVRVSPIHMSLAVVPAFIILTTLLATSTDHPGARRLPIATFTLGIAACAAAIPTYDALAAACAQAAVNLGWSMSPMKDGTPLARLRFFEIGRDRTRAIDYLHARTVPGDPIFVGLSQHDRVYINDVGFYFISNLSPATKWYHFDPGLQTSAPIQQLIIRDLANSRPQYIVLESQWAGVREPNASSLSSGVRLLDQFIKEHYQPVAEFGSLSVLKAMPDWDRAVPLNSSGVDK